MSDSLRIVVVGAGQIGSRHLQALAKLPGVAEVVAVDPLAESLERAAARWRDVPGHEHANLKLVSSVEEVPAQRYDLAVLTTSAPGRLEQLRTVAGLGIKRVLAEKLLFQSLEEIDAALEICCGAGIRLYPNYVYRYASPWAVLAKQFGSKPFELHVVAGDIGLATNLPHWLDLFEYLAASPLSELSVELARPAYPNKRGGDLLEFAGRAEGRSVSGAQVVLSFVSGSGVPVATIHTANGELVLDEGTGMVSGSLADPEMKLEMPMVSHTTSLAVPDILAELTVLPELAATAPMNRLLLQAVGRALFGEVAYDRIIPIT